MVGVEKLVHDLEEARLLLPLQLGLLLLLPPITTPSATTPPSARDPVAKVPEGSELGSPGSKGQRNRT